MFYLVFRASAQRNIEPEQDFHQKIIENLKKMNGDINELKMDIDHYHVTIQKEFKQWRAERQAFETSLQAQSDSKNSQTLFLNDRYRDVFDLQKQGLSVDQIAKELERGSGEVSFILQLAAQERS